MHDYSYILHGIELVITAIIGLLIYIFSQTNKTLKEDIAYIENDLKEVKKDIESEFKELKKEVDNVKKDSVSVDKSLALLTKQIEIKDQHTQQYIHRLESLLKEMHKSINEIRK